MGQNQSGQPVPSVNQEGQQNDGVTWWCKIIARTTCVVAGLIAVITGLFRLLTFTPLCLVAGIFLMMHGFALIVLEAPCFCQFLDFIQPVSRFSERRAYWQKALLYALPAFFPPMLCFSLTTMCGSAVLIAGGAVYGMIALGKKADRDTMMTRARGEDLEMKETLISNEQPLSMAPANP